MYINRPTNMSYYNHKKKFLKNQKNRTFIDCNNIDVLTDPVNLFLRYGK